MDNFGNVKERVIRKPRSCCYCGEIMNKGEIAQHFKGKFQGEWQDWTMHTECFDYYQSNDDGKGFSLYDNERPK